MNVVKYSIIIPVYNVENYIRDCINSLCRQSYGNFELIVIDDASTDNSFNIIKEFCHDARLRLFRNDYNKGVSYTRNYGLSIAKGEYILFIDSDDYVSERLLEKINNFNQDIIYYDYYEFDEITGEKIIKKTCNDSVDWIKKINISSVIVAACKKNVYLKNKIMFPDGLLHEDDEVSLRLAFHAGTLAYIPEPLYYYRVNRSGSIMNKKNIKMINDLFVVTKRNIDYFRNIMNENDFSFFVKEICVEKLFDYLIYDICQEISIKELLNNKTFIVEELNNTGVRWNESRYFRSENRILNIFRNCLKYDLFVFIFHRKTFRRIISIKMGVS